MSDYQDTGDGLMPTTYQSVDIDVVPGEPIVDTADIRSYAGDIIVRVTLPHRVQLSRKKGWRMPPNTSSVARPHKWGNPFRIVKGGDGRYSVSDGAGNLFGVLMSAYGARTRAVSLYRDLVASPIGATQSIIRAEFAGRNLACFCALDQPCHADVLLAIANMRITE